MASLARDDEGLRIFGHLEHAPHHRQINDENLVSLEISRLRAELARVTMERDILGKATAFFAKGQK